MRNRLCRVLVLVVSAVCIAQESVPKPQNLRQAKDALSRVFAERKLPAEIALKEEANLLTLKYKTAKFMVPPQRKNRPVPGELVAEEGPQPDGIMMRLAVILDPDAPSQLVRPPSVIKPVPSDAQRGLPPGFQGFTRPLGNHVVRCRHWSAFH